MKAKIYNAKGEVVGEMELPAAIFDLPFNADLVHQILRIERANKRRPLAYVRGRGEVSGGGRKPWAQKGTGRARHGSIRSPLWKGGGVTHGPTKERKFSLKLNKKMRRKAIAMVLGEKVKRDRLVILDSVDIGSGKTRDAARVVDKFCGAPAGRKSALVLLAKPDKTATRAYRNLARVKVSDARSLNLSDLLERQYAIMSKESVLVLADVLRL